METFIAWMIAANIAFTLYAMAGIREILNRLERDKKKQE